MIGVTTPLGILAVNGAAFVMGNLATFRITLGACALVSSLLLNGLAGSYALRLLNQKTPSLYLEYRIRLIALAVLLVLGSSVAAAIFTYQGMASPKLLPNGLAILGSVVALGLPFVVTFVSRRLAGLRGMGAPLSTARKRASAYRR